MFQDASGGRHPLGLSYVFPGPDCQNIPNPPVAWYSGAPGSDDIYQGSMSGISPVTVTDPDGTKYSLPVGGHGGPNHSSSSLPTLIEDRNGNEITFTDLGGGAFKLTDTLGRGQGSTTPAISSSGFGSTAGDTITVSGLAQAYKVSWGTANVNMPRPNVQKVGGDSYCTGISAYVATHPVVTSITLPNGQGYHFEYEATYGLLSKVTYPTGGYVRYTWGTSPLAEFGSFTDSLGNANGCQYQYDSMALTGRFVSFDGKTEALAQNFSYSTNWSASGVSWTTKQTTVTTEDLLRGGGAITNYTYSPNGFSIPPNVTSNFAQALPVEQTIVYQDWNGATLRTVNKTWHDPEKLQSEQVTLDTSQTSETDYSYGPGAQVTEKDEYDYGEGARGPLLRKTLISYAALGSTGIVDRPSSVATYDGGGNRVAETDYSYDGGTLQSAGITIGRDPSYNGNTSIPRGNATTRTQQCLLSCSNAVTSYAYDDTGQRLSMTDPKSNTTNYSYTDSWVCHSNSCGSAPGQTNAYLTKITYPPTGGVQHVENFSYGYTDGQLTVSKDQNGQATTYKYYDSLARLTETDYPDGGQTTLTYNDAPPAPSINTSTKLTSSGQSITTARLMDGLGHVTGNNLTSDPEGVDFTDTTYDGLGRAWTQSNPHRSTSSATDGTTTYVYDAVGRVTLVVPPDGTTQTNNVRTLYSGNATTVTDQAGSQRRSVTDALGRLIEVDEPSAAEGAPPTVEDYYPGGPSQFLQEVNDDLTWLDSQQNGALNDWQGNALPTLTTPQFQESGIVSTPDLSAFAQTAIENIVIDPPPGVAPDSQSAGPDGFPINYSPQVLPVGDILLNVFQNSSPQAVTGRCFSLLHPLANYRVDVYSRSDVFYYQGSAWLTQSGQSVTWQIPYGGAWAASTAYSLYNQIIDSNGNVERVTVAGTSGSSQPVWQQIPGNTTTDGGVTWINMGTGNAASGAVIAVLYAGGTPPALGFSSRTIPGGWVAHSNMGVGAKLKNYRAHLYVKTDIEYSQEDNVPIIVQDPHHARVGSSVIPVVGAGGQMTVHILYNDPVRGWVSVYDSLQALAAFQNLPRSFDIPTNDPLYESDTSFFGSAALQNRSYLYDDALAMMAYAAAGDYGAAEKIVQQLNSLLDNPGYLASTILENAEDGSTGRWAVTNGTVANVAANVPIPQEPPYGTGNVLEFTATTAGATFTYQGSGFPDSTDTMISFEHLDPTGSANTYAVNIGVTSSSGKVTLVQVNTNTAGAATYNSGTKTITVPIGLGTGGWRTTLVKLQPLINSLTGDNLTSITSFKITLNNAGMPMYFDNLSVGNLQPANSLSYSYDIYNGQVDQAYIRAGAMAWLVYAYCAYMQTSEDYTPALYAQRMINFLETLKSSASDLTNSLYYSGWGKYANPGYQFVPGLRTDVSTEAQVDLYFAWKRAANVLPTAATQLLKQGLITQAQATSLNNTANTVKGEADTIWNNLSAKLYTAPSSSNWAASHAYSVGDQVTDSHGNFQKCVVAGTSGAAAPPWSTTLGNTTKDGGATWELTSLAGMPGHFAQGAAGTTIDTSQALDASGTWAALLAHAAGHDTRATECLKFVYQNFYLTNQQIQLSNASNSYNQTYQQLTPFSGFKPYNDSANGYSGSPASVWQEGTWGMILALLRLHNVASVAAYFNSVYPGGIDGLLTTLINDQETVENTTPDGSILGYSLAARDLPWEFEVWPMVAATSWFWLTSNSPDLLLTANSSGSSGPVSPLRRTRSVSKTDLRRRFGRFLAPAGGDGRDNGSPQDAGQTPADAPGGRGALNQGGGATGGLARRRPSAASPYAVGNSAGPRSAGPSSPSSPSGGSQGSLGTPWVATYSYDALDNLTQVQQQGNDPNSADWRTRTFVYDSLSRLTSASNPESGTTSFYYTASGGSLCSGDPSAVCRRTDARGITITYAYNDALNRLTGKTYSDSTSPVTYSYDQSSFNGLTITNGIGRRTGMSDGPGAEAWSYDQMGRVLADRRTSSSVTKNISYAYNLDGSMKTVTYPSGRVITYNTGNAGRPLSAVDTANGINYALSATYAPPGELTSLVLGQTGSFAGIKLTQGYDSRLQSAAVKASSVSGTALDLAYNFNLGTLDNGNVGSITNNRDANRSQVFSYDGLNRIATAATQVGTGGEAWGLAFGYDAWANLLSATVTQGTAPMLSVSVNTNNQITNTGFAYDAAGNLTNDGSLAYNWDAESRLKSAGTTTYAYDGDGKRVKKSSGQLYWYGAGSAPLLETDLSGNNPVEYLFFGGKRIARRLSSGSVQYYFADHLGSSRVVTDSSGNILDDSDFYPFGGERAVASTSGNTYKFTGKERDAESGNDDFAARYYESGLGRFLTPDPENEGAGPRDPQSWNAYAYVRNSPTRLTDPEGERYSVCQTDPDGNETNCADISDEQFAQFEQENEDLFTFTGGDTGNILYQGNEIGTFQQTSVDLSQDAQTVLSNAYQTAAGPVNFFGGLTMGFLGFFGPGILESSLATPLRFGLMGQPVIGKVADLGPNLGAGERELALPDRGTPEANWVQNSRRLQQEMAEGRPIKDATALKYGGPDKMNTGFLARERALLRQSGWSYDGRGYWWPPSR